MPTFKNRQICHSLKTFKLRCSFRLFAHADDPDIDDPFEAPKGYLMTDPTPAPGGGKN